MLRASAKRRPPRAACNVPGAHRRANRPRWFVDLAAMRARASLSGRPQCQYPPADPPLRPLLPTARADFADPGKRRNWPMPCSTGWRTCIRRHGRTRETRQFRVTVLPAVPSLPDETGLPRGEVTIIRISSGETIIGFLYNFIWRARMSAYQSGFASHDNESRAKPGLTCHCAAIQEALGQGFDFYDFLAGDDRYNCPRPPSSWWTGTRTR